MWVDEVGVWVVWETEGRVGGCTLVTTSRSSYPSSRRTPIPAYMRSPKRSEEQDTGYLAVLSLPLTVTPIPLLKLFLELGRGLVVLHYPRFRANDGLLLSIPSDDRTPPHPRMVLIDNPSSTSVSSGHPLHCHFHPSPYVAVPPSFLELSPQNLSTMPPFSARTLSHSRENEQDCNTDGLGAKVVGYSGIHTICPRAATAARANTSLSCASSTSTQRVEEVWVISRSLTLGHVPKALALRFTQSEGRRG